MNMSNEKETVGTDEQQNQDQQTPLHNYSHKGKKIIGDRIEELASEWDVERTFLLNAAVISLSGALLGAFVNKKWFILSAAAAIVMAEQAVTGWSPPMGMMKKLGKRTRDEITRERYGLKAMKGDFKNAKDPKDVWSATE
ncbi:hypothetical protein BH11BAC1_BH11BAC1_05790 [soil metagenome]